MWGDGGEGDIDSASAHANRIGLPGPAVDSTRQGIHAMLFDVLLRGVYNEALSGMGRHVQRNMQSGCGGGGLE